MTFKTKVKRFKKAYSNFCLHYSVNVIIQEIQWYILLFKKYDKYIILCHEFNGNKRKLYCRQKISKKAVCIGPLSLSPNQQLNNFCTDSSLYLNLLYVSSRDVKSFFCGKGSSANWILHTKYSFLKVKVSFQDKMFHFNWYRFKVVYDTNEINYMVNLIDNKILNFLLINFFLG